MSFSPRLALLATAATLLACKVTIGGDSQPPEPTVDAEPTPTQPEATDPKIDGPRMLTDLELLSDDRFGGRFTFSDHLGMAADHLAAQYKEFAIAPVGDDYRWTFAAPAGRRPTDEVVVWVDNGKDSKLVAGDALTTLSNGQGKAVFAEAVGVVSLDRVKGDRVKGKIVLAPAPEPAVWLEKLTALAELSPAGVVLISDGPAPDPKPIREGLAKLELPAAWISTDDAKSWMGVQADRRRGPRVGSGTKISMAAKDESYDEDSFNVIAYIPGTTKPQEIVVLGAHYDHIGTSEKGQFCSPMDGDTICNGADDNGSGTVMVLEIARAFVEANQRPERSIVFAHFAGEELGLHGSKAMASKPPTGTPFADGKVVAMVNLDMVGRLGEDGLAIGGVGSSDAWMPLLDELGTRDMNVVYERAINSRSDHASFYREKVPVLFFFTGLHEDYHKASDHYDKINGDGMITIAQLVADLVHKLADGHDVPYAAPRNDNEGVVSRMPGASDATVEKRGDAEAPARKKE